MPALLAAVAVAVSGATVLPPAAQSTAAVQPAAKTVTAAELFDFAHQAVAKGRAKVAERALRALTSDPDKQVRGEARFRLAQLLHAQGRTRDAAVLLRQILDEQPGATPVRLQLAQLLERMGDSDAAWREVRAAQAAGLPPAVGRLVDRYSEALRATRPTGANFEIAIAPDSNISRSTRSDTLGTVLGEFEIGQDSKAKSGTGLALRGQAYRRIPLAVSGNSLLIRASGFADLYGKPRFNDVGLDLAVGPELLIGRSRAGVEIGATQRWFGQTPFMRSARISASWTRPAGARAQLRLAGSAALVDNQVNDLQDGRFYTAQLGFERALSATTGVALLLSGERQALKEPAYSTTAWRAGVMGWRDIGRGTITASAEIGRLKADERLALFPHERSDRYSRFTLGITLRRLSVGGFAPTSRLVIERNRSSIEFFDYSRTRTEFGLTRAF